MAFHLENPEKWLKTGKFARRRLMLADPRRLLLSGWPVRTALDLRKPAGFRLAE